MTKTLSEEQQILLDVWYQFSSEGKVKGKAILYDSGLSTLSWVESYLMENKIIKTNGYVYKKYEQFL